MAPGEEEELRRLGRRPCNSCEGYLEGHEPGGVCQSCIDDWQRWQRNEREATERYVRRMMGRSDELHSADSDPDKGG